ncbi:glycoside hydrolase family 3 N-terminal domain-containing protein [Alloscardovia venturai]|uniref:Glycoside hydrolase family 3 N-terminal domain-containing protein n=1 Tax=Alloscardovia venturai TaxID=1769421 RepID=A0ABW2Y7J6_9BIFI
MLSINLDDVKKILQSMTHQLWIIGIALIVAIVLTILINKWTVKNKATRKLIHSETWIAAAIAAIVAVTMILFGPLSTTLNLMSGDGKLTTRTAQQASDLGQQIEKEAVVLLKNQSNSLPMTDTKNVNVFGWASTNPIYGGTGSGAMNENYKTTSLLGGLKDAGFKTNTSLSNFYTKYRADRPVVGMWGQEWTLPEPPANTYGSELTKAKSFSNRAIVVLSRSGGEGADLPNDMSQVKMNKKGTKLSSGKWGQATGSNYINNSADYNDYKAGESYLDLTQTEKNMLDMVNKNFDDVTVVYNGANAMNLGFVDEYSNIKSVLWCPPAGQTGFEALGQVLAGTVNPSAKTTDTFIKDFTKAPWYNNIGLHNYTNMNEFTITNMFGTQKPSFVNYVEGIYVGYKFFETAAAEGAINYDEAVQYPFGYGLSYTTFEQKMGDITYANGKVSFDVTVTNTGDVAGKTPIEVYYNPPYVNGGVEKSTVNLVKFAKTKELKSGESQSVKITFNAEDMASYDESGKGAYKLDAGEYQISINADSHHQLNSKTLSVNSTITYSGTNKRSIDKTAAKNEFTSAKGDITYLSRANHFANLAQATAKPASTVLPEQYKKTFTGEKNYKDDNYLKGQNYSTKMPTLGAKNNVKLYQLYGKKYDDKMWDKLLNELTIADMDNLIANAGYNNAEISSIGKVRQTDVDGPAALNNNFTKQGSIGFPASVAVSNTFNTELAKKYGELMGKMAQEMKVTGWYAPAMNTHRSPFAGRNFEYFSEDGYLAGQMAANQIAGAKEYGVYSFMKHFALNDQETNRNGQLLTWSNEQAIREIYLKPFQASVQQGGAQAVMSSYNYIGNEWSGAYAPLQKNVLRGEWGFRGFVETDYFGGNYMIGNRAMLGGTDAMLATFPTTNHITHTDDAQIVNAMRESTHNILYTAVNSWVYKDGAPKVKTPAWQYIYYAVVAVLAVLLLLAEVVAIRRFVKRRKAEKTTAESTQVVDTHIENAVTTK